MLLGIVVFWTVALDELDWSAVIEGGVWMASDESADEVRDWLSGFIVGVGVSVLLEVLLVRLVTVGFVVAVGAAAGPLAGTVPVCVTLGILGPPRPSNLCSGSRVHPSGITTPGGKSALPAGMADVLARAPCLCIWGCGATCPGWGKFCGG